MTTAARMGAGILATGAAGLAYTVVEATRLFVLRHVTVPAARPDTAPLRILHLSDLHLQPGQDAKHRFVRRCLDSGPDLVVVTGDLMGADGVVDATVGLLGPMSSGRSALFTLGSNDFYGPSVKSPLRYFDPSAPRVLGDQLDTTGLIHGLEKRGWTCVENRRVQIRTPSGCVDVAGLGDAHVDHDRPGDWSAGGPGGPGSDDDPVLRLGVAHAPYLRVLDTLMDEHMDLTLAGHTHGGQVRVPGFGALVDNCDLPLGQARGLSRHAGRMWLHVSAGLGTSRYTPIRFACRPEASIIDVVAVAPDGAAG